MNMFMLVESAFAGAALGVCLFWRRAFAGVLVWLAILVVVPYWGGVAAGGLIVPMCVAFGAVVLLPTVLSVRAVWHVLDFLAIGFVASCVMASVLGFATWYDTGVVAAQWGLGYTLGRFWGSDIDRGRLATVLALFGAVVGAFACLEFLMDWHPFTQVFPGTAVFDSWSWIQYRGGEPRSEWTFGHSIALGNVLAMCIPFVFGSKLSLIKRACCIIVMLGGITVTFSRNAMIAALIGLVIGVLLLVHESPKVRARMVVWLAVLAVTVLPFGLSVWGRASEEVSLSTDDRLQLFSLLGDIKFLGASGTLQILSDGQPGYESAAYSDGAARTIDNTFIYLGLNLGWVPVAFSLLLVVSVALLQVKKGLRSAAGVAIVAQLPTLATVAMITQYGMFFWVVLGIAVSGYTQVEAPRVACGETAESDRRDPRRGLAAE